MFEWLGLEVPDGAKKTQEEIYSEFRIYQPLWLPSNNPAGIEMLIHRKEDIGLAEVDITTDRGPEKYLFRPEMVTANPHMKKLMEVHTLLHRLFVRRYGELVYGMFKYLIGKDGSIKISGVDLRGFTPSLELQGQQGEYSRRIALVAAEKLVELANQ